MYYYDSVEKKAKRRRWIYLLFVSMAHTIYYYNRVYSVSVSLYRKHYLMS